MQTGRVRIYVKGKPELAVEGWLDDATPEISGGVGGWTEIARPRRTALVEWAGVTLRAQSFGLLLDGHASGQSVQVLVNRLEAWGRPVGKAAPPVLTIEGAGLEHTDLEWVLNGLTRGDGILDASGKLTRRALQLELLEFVESAFLLPSSSGASKFKLVPVLRGDTLKKLSARHLKSAKKWRVLQKLNPSIRDPNKVLWKKGKKRKIRVPR